MIRAAGVTVRAPARTQARTQGRTQARPLLDDVSATVVPGRVLGVLGPNGAGKSTLMEVLSGWRVPDRGDVTLDGVPMSRLGAAGLARRRAVLPQAPRLDFAFTVAEVVALGRQSFAAPPAGDPAVAAACEALGLTGLMSRDYTTLSGGEQQRTHMARAAAQCWPSVGRPAQFLLLDEPTSALDPRHRRAALDLVRMLARAGLGVAMILHDLNAAVGCTDDVLLLRAGRVVAAGPTAQTMTAAALEQCYDTAIEVVRRGDGSSIFVL